MSKTIKSIRPSRMRSLNILIDNCLLVSTQNHKSKSYPPPPHTHTHSHTQVELDELESQIEEYCLTRAFLSLLNALIDVPPPPGLGAGHRVPGFDPYLEFVRDNVFLRFDSRGYRNAEEKVCKSIISGYSSRV